MHLRTSPPTPLNSRGADESTELTVEGIVARADSALTPDEGSVYTDYLIDVTRVFRMSRAMVSRPRPRTAARIG